MGNNYLGSNNNKIQSLVNNKINFHAVKAICSMFKFDHKISPEYNFTRTRMKK